MTSIYFVRHAQPNFKWADDMTRPLTEEGRQDCKEVVKTLANIPLDYAISSPYQRSIHTILECADAHGLEIHTDIRFREREKGNEGSNSHEMLRRRWADFSFHEEGGESLQMVQERNIEGLWELLDAHQGENILFGTHGTALSTILNYFHPGYDVNSFFRMVDYMPYVIRLDFRGHELIGQEEILIIEKEYNP